jgi:hypothetical protein
MRVLSTATGGATDWYKQIEVQHLQETLAEVQQQSLPSLPMRLDDAKSEILIIEQQLKRAEDGKLSCFGIELSVWPQLSPFLNSRKIQNVQRRISMFQRDLNLVVSSQTL